MAVEVLVLCDRCRSLIPEGENFYKVSVKHERKTVTKILKIREGETNLESIDFNFAYNQAVRKEKDVAYLEKCLCSTCTKAFENMTITFLPPINQGEPNKCEK